MNNALSKPCATWHHWTLHTLSVSVLDSNSNQREEMTLGMNMHATSDQTPMGAPRRMPPFERSLQPCDTHSITGDVISYLNDSPFVGGISLIGANEHHAPSKLALF